MPLNVKVGPIGLIGMLKFANMAKDREKVIRRAKPKIIVSRFKINENSKTRHPRSLKLKVVDIIPNAIGKTLILSRNDGAPLPFFLAGQYLSLKLKIGGSYVTRPYSISSSPMWAKEGKYAVTVRECGGFVSDYLLKYLNVGDVIESSSPQGNFSYSSIRDKNEVVAIAGGSGITPFLSMAYSIRDGLDDFNLTILYGVKNEREILFREEFDKISLETSKVKVVYVLSEETVEGHETGFITSELINKYSPESYSVFLCGPEAMYKFVGQELKKLEIPDRLIRREMLGVSKNIATNDDYPEYVKSEYKITIIQHGVEYCGMAKSNEPVLVSIERLGIKAPSKCRSGECGWCRSKLVSGECYIPKENDFRRYSDTQIGYIHPCATFPLSDIVVEVPDEY